MPAIEEHIQVFVERYNYSNHSWDRVAELGDADVISAVVKRQCCADGAYEIGGVYAATISIVCKVPGMTYFQMKRCRLKVKHQYGSGDVTNIGVFYVSDVKKTGELFSISGQDAITWTDISSKCAQKWSCGPDLYQECLNTDKTMDMIIEAILGLAGGFVEKKSGINYALKFKPYDMEANGGWAYANAYVPNWAPEAAQDGMIHLDDLVIDGIRHCEQDPSVRGRVHNAYFGIYIPDGGGESNLFGNARSDTPRDFLRYAAEVTGGFIYADYGNVGNMQDTDFVTLGQFGEPKWGIAEINMDDIEIDTCEVADFDILPVIGGVKAELKEYTLNYWIEASTDFRSHSYIRFDLSDNPFVDRFTRSWCPPSQQYDTGALFLRLAGQIWDAFYHMYGGNGGYTIRPFHATVHKPVDFHLGQRIRFRDYKDYGETVAHTYDSILTSIQWTFRGGYKLACGGEDERTMSDVMRASKADKVRRQLQDDMDALRANS